MTQVCLSCNYPSPDSTIQRRRATEKAIAILQAVIDFAFDETILVTADVLPRPSDDRQPEASLRRRPLFLEVDPQGRVGEVAGRPYASVR